MSMKKLWLAAIYALVITTGTGFAQSDPRQASPDDIRALLREIGTEDVIAQLGQLAAQQISLAFHKAHPGLGPRADSVIAETVVTYVNQLAQRDRVMDRLIPIYTKYLSKEDVQAIRAFYRSPAGRKLVATTPALTAESAKVGEVWMQSILPGLQEQLRDKLRKEKLIE
jgi:uncharacterized protein